MLGYYLDLSLRSLRRNKVLTALMVLAIGLGVGASMTMLTILHVMTADPIPGRSAQLFYPQIDPMGMEGYAAGAEPPDQLTWTDAMNLLHAKRGTRQVAMTGGQVAVRPAGGKARTFFADARYATADFFAMFQVPFAAGGGWDAAADGRQARVAVISRKLADKLYGGARQAVGQALSLGRYDFRVLGVIDRWDPVPHYYDLTHGSYGHSEDVFLPLETGIELKLGTAGNISCWSREMPDDMRKADCVWTQFWVQLDSPQAVADYRDFLAHYSQEQHRLGRFQRPPNVRLRDVMGRLAASDVVPGSVQLQALLASGFLLVCLINTVALLLVKFLRRGGELAVRRAMGASRRTVFAQLLVEAGLIGVGGGLAGLLLAWCGLWIVRQQPVDYAALAHLDLRMLAATLLLATLASLLAAVFPAWRACGVAPARALKIQ